VGNIDGKMEAVKFQLETLNIQIDLSDLQDTWYYQEVDIVTV
jgi:hypothetical protein